MDTALQPVIQTIIIGYVPALGLPIIKQISGEIEAAIENYITKQAEIGVDFAVIDTQTDQEDSKIQEAQKALNLANASGNAQAIAAAQEEFQDAESGVANDDGAAELK